MIRPKMKQKIYYYPLLKIVKLLLNKPIEKHKKPSSSSWLDQKKHLILLHQFTLKEIGC